MSISLSKILPLLVYPANLGLWLSVIAFFLLLRRKNRLALYLLGSSVLIFWIFGLSPVAVALYQNLESKHPPIPLSALPQADVIVVLGGSVGAPIPPRTDLDLTGSSDRVRYAAQLFKAGKAPKIIATGGNVFEQKNAKPEAYYVRDLLIEWGVEPKAIVIETKSRNTYENAIETRRFLRQGNKDKVLLVTSAVHMPRALATFRSNGINAIPATTDVQFVSYDKPALLDWIPSAGGLAVTTAALKEYLGYLVYWWRGYIKH